MEGIYTAAKEVYMTQPSVTHAPHPMIWYEVRRPGNHDVHVVFQAWRKSWKTNESEQTRSMKPQQQRRCIETVLKYNRFQRVSLYSTNGKGHHPSHHPSHAREPSSKPVEGRALVNATIHTRKRREAHHCHFGERKRLGGAGSYIASPRPH